MFTLGPTLPYQCMADLLTIEQILSTRFPRGGVISAVLFSELSGPNYIKFWKNIG